MGPTACGKTRFACRLAHAIDGEIISADSRQVYKGLDIGTGKDLSEYEINGKKIPHHLINLSEPGQQFYLHQFMQHLGHAFNDISARARWPIVCGGTGLYLDALRKDFSLTQIPENESLRNELKNLDKEELLIRLKRFPAQLTEKVDENSKKRIMRGIEIATYLQEHPRALQQQALPYQPLYFGLDPGIEERKKRITARLKYRLENGMIEEAQGLLQTGISHFRLQQLGLEYKFLSLFLQHKISDEELFVQLQTAIFQFAKRQMTWFRRMEKEGVKINWLRSENDLQKAITDLTNPNRLPETFS